MQKLLWCVGIGGSLLILIDPVIAFGATVVVSLVVATAYKPAIGIAAWLLVLVLVPDWTPSLPGLKPISAIGAVVLVGLTLSRYRQNRTMSWADLSYLCAALLVGVLTFTENYPLWMIANVVGVLGVSYFLGRTAPTMASRAYVFAMVVVAIWGVIEFLTGFHLFENFATSPSYSWPEIQTRAGFPRSEGAFGHAIAYGACIVMALPLTVDLKRGRGIVRIVLVAGVIASLSRGPLLAMVVTIALMVIFLSRGAQRVWGIVGSLLAGVLVVSIFTILGDADDAARTENSGNARWIQLTSTIGDIRWIGSRFVSENGIYIDTLENDVIDNALLRLSLNYGWVVAVLLVIPLVVPMVNLIARRATSASIAIVGQVPVLLVTSLITQWQAALYFLAGLAITQLLTARSQSRNSSQEKESRRSDTGLVASSP